MRTRGLAVVTVLAATVAPSYAGVIQNYFAGTVTSVSQWGPTSVTDLFHVGYSVRGLLSYSTPNTSIGGSSTDARYYYDPAGVYGLSITTGGLTFATMDAGGPQLELDIRNDDFYAGLPGPVSVSATLTDDVNAVGKRGSGLPGHPGLFYGGRIEQSINIIQQTIGPYGSSSSDLGPTLLVTSPGVSLPFSIDLSRATSATGYIQSTDGISDGAGGFTNGYRIEFNITDFGQTPEPASLPLILGGGAVLAALRRTRARR